MKPFQDGILAAQGNVSNFGIINSPASGKQVESLLKGIFDESGNPIGFVGFAVNTDSLIDTLNNLSMNGMEAAEYEMINIADKKYIFNVDSEKVSTETDNPKLVALCEKFVGQDSDDTGYIEYKENGTRYIATYHYMASRG